MLEAKGSTFLYQQLQNVLRQEILAGVYKEGDQMPSEVQLGEFYQVSRITVRRALKELSREGFLEMRQGKGTFVKPLRLDIQFLKLGGFSDGADSDPSTISKKIVEKVCIPAGAELAERFQITEGDPLLRLVRTVRGKSLSVSLDTAFFPLDLFPGIDEKITDQVSTFAVLQEDYGVVMASAVKEISFATADVRTAGLMTCNVGEPLFLVKKAIADAQGRVIHYSEYYLLARRTTFSITVPHQN